MRIIYLGNNYVGLEVLKWLKNEGKNIVGLIVHPKEKQKYTDEIVKLAAVAPENVFDGSKLQQSSVLESIKKLNPDIGFSVLFDYILKDEFIKIFPKGIINLHPAYLPYNRGQYPNVWSIIEGTPAGVTLHYVDDKIDTGDIIDQVEVDVEPIDTGQTLYAKLEKASIELVKNAWLQVESGIVKSKKQKHHEGTYHRTKDVDSIDKIDLDRLYKAKDLINILRSRTFPPYKGAFFEIDGKRVYLSLKLEYE